MSQQESAGTLGDAVRRIATMDRYKTQTLENPKFDDQIPGLATDPAARPVVLYNVSHQGRSPLPANPADPAIRLLGIFRDGPEAIREAGMLARKSEEIDYWITPVGQWLMMHVDRGSDSAAVQARIEQRLEKHSARRDRDFEQLKAAREKKLQSRTSYQKKEREARLKAETGSDETDPPKKNNVGDIPHKYMSMNQRYAVISVLRDTEQAVRLGRKFPEPLVRVYATYSSKKQAMDFIRETLSPHVGEYDLDVVDTYQWLYPQSVESEDLAEEFRDPEINNIMQHAKLEKKTTRDFRKRCAETGKQADMAYIVGDDSGRDTVTLVEQSPESGEMTRESGSLSPEPGEITRESGPMSPEPGEIFRELDAGSDFNQRRAEFLCADPAVLCADPAVLCADPAALDLPAAL